MTGENSGVYSTHIFQHVIVKPSPQCFLWLVLPLLLLLGLLLVLLLPILQPWQAFAANGGRAVMTSHQTVSHMPCHANPWLVNSVLRDKYMFGMYIMLTCCLNHHHALIKPICLWFSHPVRMVKSSLHLALVSLIYFSTNMQCFAVGLTVITRQGVQQIYSI